MCYLWDKQLNSTSTTSWKNNTDKFNMWSAYQRTLFLRTDTRKENVEMTDFLHGRSIRFMNFRKSIKMSSSNTCRDCSTNEDSAYHKLFECHIFDCDERHQMLSLASNEDEVYSIFEMEVVFSNDPCIREYFKKLIQKICQISKYDSQEEFRKLSTTHT